jgi:hypothetical protein
VINQIKSKLPDIINNDVATKIFNIAKKGVQNKQISLNDLLNVTNGLSSAIKTGDKNLANKAVAQNTSLKRLGLDVVIGDISQSIDDPAVQNLPHSITGDKIKGPAVFGGKLVLAI